MRLNHFRFVYFSDSGKHHVQHLFQNVRVQLRARNPLQEPHQRTAVQVFRVRSRIFDKGTIRPCDSNILHTRILYNMRTRETCRDPSVPVVLT